MPLVSKNKNNDYNDDDKDEESLSSSSNFVPVKKTDKKFVWEYNNRTAQSYTKNGLKAPDNLDMQERTFLSKVSVNEKAGHEIRRTVTKICRVKTIDYSSKKLERKEFLYYYENWNGVNWRGIKISPCTDHIEGMYQEQEMEPKIGEQPDEIIGYKRTGQYTVYYIPFSKEKVDEIVSQSVGSDKETILFNFSIGALGYEFPFDTFVNTSFDDLAHMLVQPGGPRLILANRQQQQQEKPKEGQTSKLLVNKQEEQVIKQKQ